MKEPLTERQMLAYIAMFIDSDDDVAKEAERMGITHKEIQILDRALEATSDDENN